MPSNNQHIYTKKYRATTGDKMIPYTNASTKSFTFVFLNRNAESAPDIKQLVFAAQKNTKQNTHTHSGTATIQEVRIGNPKLG